MGFLISMGTGDDTDIHPTNFMNFIICSHRIQNIDWVDKILVLNQGRIEDIGSHQELIKRCSLYQNLYASHKDSQNIGVPHE